MVRKEMIDKIILMKNKPLKDFVVEQLEEIKAKDIKVIELREDNTIADYMVICCGTSSRRSFNNIFSA